MIRLMETTESGDDLGAAFLTDGAYMVHGDDLEGILFNDYLQFDLGKGPHILTIDMYFLIQMT